MADIVLTGDTSGAITVAAPAVAGTNTLTLPASTGTLLTTTGDGSGLTSLPEPDELSTASGSAPSYSARAWVNFNGTGTVAIRDSGNVSSIVDTGVGIYTVNFATAMPDADYAMSGSAGNITGTTGTGRSQVRNSTWTASTAYFRNVLLSTQAPYDDTYIGLMFIR
jgi:hypothetical protein